MNGDTPRIVCDPKIQLGKPMIRGTRVLAGDVADRVWIGLSVEKVAGEFKITTEDVLAALDYVRGMA